jgi:hypothetical protein
MKRVLHKTTIFFVAICMMVVMSTSAFAGSLTATPGSHSFASDWDAIVATNTALLQYGYNTYGINEDFAWAYHNNLPHWAGLKYGTVNNWGPTKAAGAKAVLEKVHATISVYSDNW